MSSGGITTEERADILQSFERVLVQKCRESDVRRTMATADGHDRELWNTIVDLGMTGLLIDPRHGGIGAGPVEIELVMERAGKALLAGPFLANAVLAAGLLGASSDEEAKQRLLPAIMAGDWIATVALTGEGGFGSPTEVGVTAREADGWRLDGMASYVSCAHIADTLFVIAQHGAALSAFEVDPASSGVLITPIETWDRTLRLSRISFHDVAATLIAGCDDRAIGAALDLGRVALAGEQVGAARHLFEMTIDYIRTRIQFGRPVGGFQALKHMAADLLLELESATSAVRDAAQALADAAPDARSRVALAAFACTDMFSQIAASAIQMHGGIAFTWEHPAHLYLRRARADAQLLGSASYHRERFISLLEQAA